MPRPNIQLIQQKGNFGEPAMTITVSKTFENEADAAAWLAGSGKTSTASAPAPAATKPTATKPAAAPAKPAYDREAMVAVMNDLAEKKGKDAAKAIISGVGGVKKMAEIPDEKIGDVFEAAKAKLEEDEDM